MTAPNVELRTLRVFLALAEELHFARTADHVGLTPSRVSQVVRDLERQVGSPLFARTSRRVALTPAGERLRAALVPLCAGLDAALRDARDQASGVVGEVRVGAYLLINLGPDFFVISSEFSVIHPEAAVRVVDIGMQRNPLEALRGGEIDVLAMRLPVSDTDLVVGPRLTREGRVAVVGQGHPLAARESISYEDLADYYVNDPSQMPRELIEAFVPHHTPSGRPVRRIAHHTVVAAMAAVAAGDIVHLTVPSFLENNARPYLTAIPVVDLPPSETALVWLTDNATRGVVALAELVERRSSVSGPRSALDDR